MSSINTEIKLTAKDYKSNLKPVWCPGCGDFGVLNSIYKAFAELQIPRHEIAVISGIGCSSRLPGYMNAYGFNTVHGRAIPIATGVKTARPETTVMAVGGDGDGLSIGGGHLPHVCRRNIDLTYILMDNRIYGLTKGQCSPTTELETKTKTTKYGAFEDPLNPALLTIAYNASFVARAVATDAKALTRIIVEAIQHKGFSFVQVFSRCVTFRGNDQYSEMKSGAKYLEDNPDYNPGDRYEAMRTAEMVDPDKLGILYKARRPSWDENYENIRKIAKGDRDNWTIEDVVKQFTP